MINRFIQSNYKINSILLRSFLLLFIVVLIPISAKAQCPDKACSSCEDTTVCGKNQPKSAAAKLTALNIQAQEEDTFEPYNPSDEQSSESSSSSEDDEFIEYNAESDTNSVAQEQEILKEEKPIYSYKLFFPIVSLIMTALAGVFVRFKSTRRLRGVFLALSVIFLGFYVGACPCPISSFSFTIIAMTGGEVNWENMIWFLGLIPLTFVFHKTWCGWVCHLGALQEFLFMKSSKLEFLKSCRTQKVLKIMRYIFVGVLIVQLVFTHSYLFNQVDPFRVAYNLGYNAGYLEWILLGLLVLTSIFIYRPFCKGACPIGLVLGWITKIPGAAVLDKNKDCLNCSLCATNCDHQAIYRENKISIIDNKECIACGECMQGCKKCGIEMYRHNNEHKDVNKICKDNLK